MKNNEGQKILRYTELVFREARRRDVTEEEKQEMAEIRIELNINNQQILAAAEKKLIDANVGDRGC